MSRQALLIGAAEGDGTGDRARIGSNKINLNFAELYSFLGGDTLPTMTAGRVALSGFTDDANLTWDATNQALTIGAARYFTRSTTCLFIGDTAGNFTQSGTNNTVMGWHAGQALTTGNENTFIGANAGVAVNSGGANFACGAAAMESLTTGSSNVALGKQSFRFAGTSSSGNTAIGATALSGTGLKSNNVCIGGGSGGGNGDAVANTFVGESSGTSLTSGDRNVGLGWGALDALTNGSRNISIGHASGGQFTTAGITGGTYNVIIGDVAGVDSATATNRIVIGRNNVGDTDNQAFLGNNACTAWVPGADDTCDLGRTARRMKNGYFSGTLRFGTFTTLGTEVLAGYITITDAGGTTRKLGVIA